MRECDIKSGINKALPFSLVVALVPPIVLVLLIFAMAFFNSVSWPRLSPRPLMSSLDKPNRISSELMSSLFRTSIIVAGNSFSDAQDSNINGSVAFAIVNNNYNRVESSKCLARMTSDSYTTQEHV